MLVKIYIFIVFCAKELKKVRKSIKFVANFSKKMVFGQRSGANTRTLVEGVLSGTNHIT